MYKIKFFTYKQTSSAVDATEMVGGEINSWFLRHKKVTVVSHTHCVDMSGKHIVSIIYSEDTGY